MMELWALKIDEIKRAVRSHYNVQLGQFFSDITKIEGGLAAYSKHIDDSFIWNHAILDDLPDNKAADFVQTVTSFYQNKNRPGAFYFSPASKTAEKVLQEAVASGYEQQDEEAFMFYLNGVPPKYETPRELNIVQASSTSHMNDFVSVFNVAYEGISNAYGDALQEQFCNPNLVRGVNHFIGYIDDTPVSIATLTARDDCAGIYSVGTLPSHRKRGFGSALSAYAINQAFKLKSKYIFLQAERSAEGPEPLYRKLGFSTVFVRLGYVKSAEL